MAASTAATRTTRSPLSRTPTFQFKNDAESWRRSCPMTSSRVCARRGRTSSRKLLLPLSGETKVWRALAPASLQPSARSNLSPSAFWMTRQTTRLLRLNDATLSKRKAAVRVVLPHRRQVPARRELRRQRVYPQQDPAVSIRKLSSVNSASVPLALNLPLFPAHRIRPQAPSPQSNSKTDPMDGSVSCVASTTQYRVLDVVS